MRPLFLSLIYTSLFVGLNSPVSASSPKVRDFVPQGWEIFQSAVGDLTGDQLADAALLIQPKNQQVKDRKLLVLQQSHAGYQVLASRDLPESSYESDCSEDAFDGNSLKIAKEVLILTFNSLPTCMNTYAGSTTYRFKLKNEQFYLIGYDTSNLDKLSGLNVDKSINLSTFKMKITTTPDYFEARHKKTEKWQDIAEYSYTMDSLTFESPLFDD